VSKTFNEMRRVQELLAVGQPSVRDRSTRLEKDRDQECSMESIERLQSSEQKPIGNRPSRNRAKLTSFSIINEPRLHFTPAPQRGLA
jgi:hypothetical protein